MERNFEYTEYAGPGSTTGTFVTIVSHGVTGSSEGEKYIIVGTVACGTGPNGAEPGGPFTVSLTDYGGNGTGASCPISPRDPGNDMYSIPVVLVTEHLPGSPPAIEFEMSMGASDGTFTYQQAGVYTMRLGPNDVYNTTQGAANSTSTSFATVTDSSVTIPRTGEYLVLSSATVNKNELTANYEIRLAVNGATFYDTQTMRAVSTTKYFPWASVVKLSLTAGDVLTIEHRVLTTGTVTTQYGQIVALFTQDLPSLLYAEDRGDDSTTSTSYQDKTGMSTTFRTPDFLSWMISCGRYRRGAASVDAWAQTLVDGTTVQESRNESVAGGHESVHFAMKGWTPTIGDHTIKQQYKSDGAGISSAFLADAAIAVITTEDNSTVKILGGSILGATIV